MATAAAALIARARREIQHHFFAADAVRADRAVPFAAENGIEQRQFEKMRAKNIILEAKPGEYWLDVVAYDIELSRRHAIQRTIILVLLAALAAAVMLGVFAATGRNLPH
ncbi:YdbL family protein [Sphingomonas alba]|uniref:YdbL family protein n=1 Tax=Sphingomonas alba TaxID=2908208 RepID=A0ABT0RNZ3_9SPHN|nr:YdbL family protein [Sphingomonas alba]MCL6684371.1 YdbL family protein [Sphingomonas alba]